MCGPAGFPRHRSAGSPAPSRGRGARPRPASSSGHAGIILGYFSIMLCLWGPSWGPLATLGALLGSKFKSHMFFTKSGKQVFHCGTMVGIILRMFCIFGQLSWGPILLSILGWILEGLLWPRCNKRLPEFMFSCFQKYNFLNNCWDDFGIIL